MCSTEDALATVAASPPLLLASRRRVTDPAPPLSPERLRQLAAEARPLDPVAPHERKGLLRDEAALLVDGLIVEVARSSGAIDVAMGECLAALCSGDGP